MIWVDVQTLIICSVSKLPNPHPSLQMGTHICTALSALSVRLSGMAAPTFGSVNLNSWSSKLGTQSQTDFEVRASFSAKPLILHS